MIFGKLGKIEKGFSEFYKRALEKLPTVPTQKPFEVKVDIQQTEPRRFETVEEAEKVFKKAQGTLGPPPPGLTSVNPNVVSSAGGTTVTITGENFAAGSTVKIAGLDAQNVNVVNATTIICTTPPDGIGFVNVEVTSPSDQTVSNASLLRYTNLPDNFVVSGQQHTAGYQGCSSGPGYFYTITARLGNAPFTCPVGTQFYVQLAFVGGTIPCGGYSVSSYTLMTNATGPTVSVELIFAISAVTPGSPGHAIYHYKVLMGGSLRTIGQYGESTAVDGTTYPTYGDSINQPNSFRIDVTGDGPPPSIGGGGDFLSWSGSTAGLPNPPFGGGGRTNPWFFGPGDPPHAITLKKKSSNGTVDSSFNGTASLTLVKQTQEGQLRVSCPSSVTFVNGAVTFSIAASYSYNNAQGSQAAGYFYFVATSGSMVNNSPQCSALNRY